ncbi:MAG: DUF4199 domain-containing protein [Chitinophagales bacterium]
MMNKAVGKYLVISVAFAVIWILIEHVAGFNTTRHDIGQFTRNANMIVFWVTIFLAIREARKNQGNKLSFGDGMKTGVALTVLYSLAFVVIILLYVQFINPDFYATYKAFTLNQLTAANATPKQMEEAMKEVDMSYDGSPQSYGLLFLFSAIFGTVLSLIASLIYRTKSVS